MINIHNTLFVKLKKISTILSQITFRNPGVLHSLTRLAQIYVFKSNYKKQSNLNKYEGLSISLLVTPLKIHSSTPSAGKKVTLCVLKVDLLYSIMR